MDAIKRRAIQVELSDQKTIVTVHAPTMSEFAEYMKSLPVLSEIGEAFRELQTGKIATTAAIEQGTLDRFYPLLALLSDITVKEFQSLPVGDGMAIMLGYVQLLQPPQPAENPTPAAEQAPPP